jgi:hypothetical protein
MLLKLAIGAMLPAIAGIIVTLSGHHAVEAAFSTVVADVCVLNAFLLAFGATKARLHFIILGDFTFAIKVDVLFDGREVFETLTQVVEAHLVVLEHADHLNGSKITSFFFEGRFPYPASTL